MASSFHRKGPITASAMATEEELVAANGRVTFFGEDTSFFTGLFTLFTRIFTLVL